MTGFSPIFSLRYPPAWMVALVILLACPTGSYAWTRATLTTVDVHMDLASAGSSTITTTVRFNVTGGRFHGFDLAPREDSELIMSECHAYTDGGIRHPLAFQELRDGRVRITLAGKQSVRAGGTAAFALVHRTDLLTSGALRRHGASARLDWTPIIWDHGTDAMTVTIAFPENDELKLKTENEVTADYDIARTGQREVQFKKHRTVKWYPMQIVLDFNPSLVLLEVSQPDTPRSGSSSQTAAAVTRPDASPPFWVASAPSLIVIIGLLLLLWKSQWVQNAHDALKVPFRFRFLANTTIARRALLSFGAAGLGLAAQYYGSTAAAAPALGAAMGLWIMERMEGRLMPRAGGVWRRMTPDEVTLCRTVLSAYRRRRRSVLDITSFCGILCFVAAMVVLVSVSATLYAQWSRTALAVALFGLMSVLCVWFSHTQAELPVDPTIETFSMLRKWRRKLRRLVLRVQPAADVSFWVREDADGPIEIRLRIEGLSPVLIGVDIAAEVVRSRTMHQVRKVAILRMIPGTELARHLAACPNAAEHHITPDLEQEIIVLRNRRGQKEMGFAPLKQAFTLLRS